jgi:hypothetical protein
VTPPALKKTTFSVLIFDPIVFTPWDEMSMMSTSMEKMTIFQSLSSLSCVGRFPAPIHIPSKLKGFLTPMGVAEFFLEFFSYWHIFSITFSGYAAIFLRA